MTKAMIAPRMIRRIATPNAAAPLKANTPEITRPPDPAKEAKQGRSGPHVDSYPLPGFSPIAEVDIGEGLVRALLAEQHPDLAHLPLVAIPGGWDNDLWRLGEAFLVRLPRRSVAAPLAIGEQQWLPKLAPHLPLPVPVPIRIGRPSHDYPWSWSVVPWLRGSPGDQTPVTEPEASAERLGRFLRALHQEAPANAPQNPYRGVPLVQRAPVFEQRVAELRTEIDAPATRRVWERALSAQPWSRPPTWAHGDLHPANTLLLNGTLAAVLDFGDLCAGDPATDLAGGVMLLPTSAWPIFTAAYGGMDAHLRRRTLGWAVLFALMMLSIGKGDRPTYQAVGRSALDKTITLADS